MRDKEKETVGEAEAEAEAELEEANEGMGHSTIIQQLLQKNKSVSVPTVRCL